MEFKKYTHLLFLTDTHTGSRHFNEEFFKYALSEYKNLPKKRRCMILGGDECEIASKNVGNSAFESVLNVNEQIEKFIGHIKPFKKEVLAINRSNHLSRLKNEFDYDLTGEIAKQLDIEAYNTYIGEISVSDKKWTLASKHGSGSSRYRHGRMGKLRRDFGNIEADLYMMGHCHDLIFDTDPYITRQGIERKYYAMGGSYLSYRGSYADINGLAQIPEGFQFIKITTNGMTADQRWIDICKPELMRQPKTDIND